MLPAKYHNLVYHVGKLGALKVESPTNFGYPLIDSDTRCCTELLKHFLLVHA